MKVEMKDSGIPWIGLVPYDWEVLPYKQVMKKTKNIKFDYQGEDIISLTMNGVVKRDLDNPKGKMPLTFDGYQIVQKGNLLLCLFDIDVTPRCVGLIQDDGLTSPAYSHFIMINNNSSVYYNYQLRYIDDIKAFLHLSKNIRSSLTETDFGIIRTIRPPFQLQQQIANFLDDKCADIDQLITLQQQMIDELKAYKQSVITEAVCKGLDKSVPMKDSGIEWIGEVPEGWKIAKLKNISSIVLGKMLCSTPPVGVENLYELKPYLKSKNIGWLELIDIENLEMMYFNKKEILQYALKNNDIVMNEGGEIGKVALWTNNTECYIQNSVHKITPNNNVFVKYLLFYLFHISKSQYFSSIVNQISIAHLTKEKLQNTPVVLPSYNEQCDISRYLETKSSQIDNLISIKQQKIDELKEYKKSMIYEYITGKKQVPNE